MDEKLIFRHLTKRVILDKDIITYRLLSRELGLNVKNAKSSMSSFIVDSTVKERGGVTPTWLISGILKPVEVVNKKEDDEMEVDSSQIQASTSTSTSNIETIRTRCNLLVPDSDLASKFELFISPTKQIYSLSSTPLHSLTLLTAYNLSNVNGEKWKKVEGKGGYGQIVHPEGEGRTKKVDSKGKGKLTTSTTTSTISKKVEDKKPLISSASTSTLKGKGKETVKEEVKPKSITTMRPIGALGGLFAKSTPSTSTSSTTATKKRKSSPQPFFKPVVKKEAVKEKEKVVAKPKAKVAEAPKKKTKIVSDGIWGDQEVTDDGSGDDGEDDEAEKVMKEIESAEDKKKAASKKKKELIEKGKSGKSESKREKESRELEIMMLGSSDEDDDMEIDAPAKSSTSKSKSR